MTIVAADMAPAKKRRQKKRYCGGRNLPGL
jgi:hypothetical protein